MALLHKSGQCKLAWSDLQNASDSELLAQLRAGNDDALAVIIDRYRRLIFSVALRIVKNESEAEDVVQTVFVEVYKHAGQFDGSRGTLKTWLLQYAYSRSINRRHWLEQRQFYSALGFDDVDPFQFADSSVRLHGLSSGETGLLVRRALASLNEQQQAAIERVYFQGLTLEEAARKTSQTFPAVRHHYYRGLLKMREFINAERSARPREPLNERALGLEVAHLKPRTI